MFRDAPDGGGEPTGEIGLEATATKTAESRIVDLAVSPALRRILTAMRLHAGNAEAEVFPAITAGALQAHVKRLVDRFGAPIFTRQRLRQTCGTYLTNAPGIFGSASVYRSARQLGHSVQVAEKHYLGLVRGISREARTLETAMQIEGLLQLVDSAVALCTTAERATEMIRTPRSGL